MTGTGAGKGWGMGGLERTLEAIVAAIRRTETTQVCSIDKNRNYLISNTMAGVVER